MLHECDVSHHREFMFMAAKDWPAAGDSWLVGREAAGCTVICVMPPFEAESPLSGEVAKQAGRALAVAKKMLTGSSCTRWAAASVHTAAWRPCLARHDRCDLHLATTERSSSRHASEAVTSPPASGAGQPAAKQQCLEPVPP